MTIQDLQNKQLIIYECISGSKAYGLDTPTSDTDIKGVFILPQSQLYGRNYIPQIANESNDIVYYELGRFFELLEANNPNILELLSSPPDKILIKHPVMEGISPEIFLSKRCKDTFGGYAMTQVKKARGLNKKIVNPIDSKKKNILEFCYVLHEQGAMPLLKWLDIHQIKQEHCGLVNIPHFKDVFGIFYDPDSTLGFKGILKKDNASTVLLSSIPKNLRPIGYLHFNQDGYTKYCKDYREYWEWVEKRNEVRYENNAQHGKGYDTKNMMHTFRLLKMAEEILLTNTIQVSRPDRDFLLSIKSGHFEYEELITMADKQMLRIQLAAEMSTLADTPDSEKAERLLIDIRSALYQQERYK
ncbi:MAG: nucleotidyltransferase domain-containing protein [Chitinophagales bacterium]|nr:nucleotidyltransferase domain-containing protein [Chitinophagales bacterium]